YHAFLDLMSQNPALFLVPTLDLAWHTHQLKGDQYRLDTQTYLQRTPNHDDNVEATSLSIAYDVTAKAWKDRFGVPYSVCGCIPDRVPGNRLSRFISRLSIFGHKHEKSDNSTEDTLVNTRPDLVTTEDHEADTSHPSEHNVYFGDPNNKKTKSRSTKRERKSIRCVANVKKSGDKDQWRVLQAERAEKTQLGLLDDKDGNKKHKEAFTDIHHGYDHYYAYWGVSAAIPLG
ncbi:11754_t:CDS:2, partial [Acaulospora colombiana]